jgi:hypothetical protein
MPVPLPVVRYFVPCESVAVDPANPLRISLMGLLTVVRPAGASVYPLMMSGLSVFAQLAEVRATHRYRVVIGPTGGPELYRSREHMHPPGPNPLAAESIVFRMSGLIWPGPGLYEIELLCDDQVIAQQPIRAI